MRILPTTQKRLHLYAPERAGPIGVQLAERPSTIAYYGPAANARALPRGLW